MPGPVSAGSAFVDIIPRLAGDFARRIEQGIAPALSRIGAQLTDVGKTMTTRVTLPIVAGFAYGAVKANDLNKNLAEVVSLTGLTGDEADAAFGTFQTGVEQLSDKLGVAQSTLVGGLYQALSAGVPQDNVFTFLDVAGRAAIAGVTDTETAVDGLSTVLNAFQLPATEAEAVADSLFTAVKGGKTTFEELSASLFQVAPTASALGIEFTDVNAALAAMTAQGVPTSEATNRVRAALNSLLQNAEKLDPVFQAMGYASTEAAVSQLGLKGSFDAVFDAADGSQAKLLELLGSTEAVQAVSILAGTGSEKFASELEAQATAAGATNAAFEEIDKRRTLDRFKVTIENLAIAVGQVLIPIIEDVVDYISPWLERFRELSPATQRIIVLVGALAAAIGPALLLIGGIASGLGAIVGAVGSVAAAVAAAGGILPFLGGIVAAALPVIAVVAAIAAAAWLIYDNWDTVGPFLADVWQRVREAAGEAWEWIKANVIPVAKDFAAQVIAGAVEVRDVFQRNWPQVRQAIERVATFITDQLIPTITDLVTKVDSFLRPILEQIATTVIPIVRDAMTSLREGMANVVAWVEERWPKIQEVIDTVANAIDGVLSFLVDYVVAPALEAIRFLWDAVGDDLLNIVEATWGYIKDIIGSAMRFIGGIIDLVMAVITGDWGAAWDAIEEIVGATWDFIKATVLSALDVLKSILGAAWSLIVSAAGVAWDFLGGLIGGALDFIKGLIGGALDFIVGLWRWQLDTVKAIVSGAWDAVVGAFRWLVDQARGVLGGIGGIIDTLVVNPFRTARDTIGGAIDAVVGFVTGLPGRLRGIGEGIAGAILSGFRTVWNAAAGAINSMIPNSISIPNPFGADVGIDLPDNPIPILHRGGRVPGRPGQDVLAILEGGERVLTAAQAARAANALAGGNAGGGLFRDLIIEAADDPRTTAAEVDAILGWRLANA